MKLESTYKKIDEWIKRIHQENLYVDLINKNFQDNSIEINPYNFHSRKNNLVFIFIGNRKCYIKIYNQRFLESIENKEEFNEYFLVPRETANGWRLSRDSKYKNQKPKRKTEKQNYDFDLFGEKIELSKPKKTVEGKKHINDIWAFKQENDFFKFNHELDQYQEEAIEKALNNEISFITGYAGSGKSHTIKQLSKIFNDKGWNVSRVAPTGRASQIILGKTIHSWLEPIIEEVSKWKYEIMGFKKDKFKIRECLIVDESSMIDDELWNEIQEVWNNSEHIKNKKIIYVGDPGQLEPVGKGQPFIDNIESKNFPITELKGDHRVKADKENLTISDHSLFVRENGRLDKVHSYQGVKEISRREALMLSYENDDYQMITPRRNGRFGSLNINKKIKEVVNKQSNCLFKTIIWNDEKREFVDDTEVHTNDRIIVTRNLWQWNITNGTTGQLIGIEKVKLFDHSKKKYHNAKKCFKFINQYTKAFFYLPVNKYIRSSMELGYVITIHKAQGSEYKNAIIFLPKEIWVDKKMLYTGVTRAKKKLLIAK